MSYNPKYQRIKARFQQLDRTIFKIMVLTVLFFGAVSPAFRSDVASKYAGIIGCVLLTILAAYFYDQSTGQSGYVDSSGTNGVFNDPGTLNGIGADFGAGIEFGSTNAPPQSFAGGSYTLNFGWGVGSYSIYFSPSGQPYAASAGSAIPDLADIKLGASITGSTGTMHTCP
ncbi:MAG: hypothetical protein RB191_19560 [Terriglobia bacterium]|nr:hypothetical protein [Terriglobia bacterium]